MPVLLLLAVVWAAFLVPPALRRHREGRPGSSVVSFRQQLSTLERATPGHSLRLSNSGPVPVVKSVAPAAKTSTQRRRDVLVVLFASTGTTFVLAVLLGGSATYLFGATLGVLGAYVYALVLIRKRTIERSHKVRPLVRRPSAPPVPDFAVRRSASN